MAAHSTAAPDKVLKKMCQSANSLWYLLKITLCLGKVQVCEYGCRGCVYMQLIKFQLRGLGQNCDL